MTDPATTGCMPTEPPSDPTPAASSTTDRDDPDSHHRAGCATDAPESGRRGAVSDDGPGSGAGEGSGDGSGSDRVAALERRVTDLEAELDAVRGLLDGVEAVDEAVERRASTALAKAEALEARVGPEEPGLVRERLSGGADDRREAVAGDRPEAADRGLDRDAGGQTRSPEPRRREEPGLSAGGPAGSVGSCGRDGSAPTDPTEHDRTHPDDAATTDQGPSGTGAISSVGSDALREGTDDADGDRSLAERLRDAVR